MNRPLQEIDCIAHVQQLAASTFGCNMDRISIAVTNVRTTPEIPKIPSQWEGIDRLVGRSESRMTFDRPPMKNALPRLLCLLPSAFCPTLYKPCQRRPHARFQRDGCLDLWSTGEIAVTDTRIKDRIAAGWSDDTTLYSCFAVLFYQYSQVLQSLTDHNDIIVGWR
ncbi:hypothetical protein [Sphingomonas sp. PP-CC-3G-468]|uniref:hypothetical protein n=1 Tax=Sphingomonas sp. PP-CC-3G-468 TaxID=2135656 RepID=UPI001049880F|nr:hypothetical protein [Sphingomonas sp. PP-CC-3G-468]